MPEEFINETLSTNATLKYFDHPAISSIHVNSLPSNKAMEDRHAVHLCPRTGVALVTVIDGHSAGVSGWCCAEHVKQNLSTYVADHLNRIEANVTFSDVLENSIDLMYSSTTAVMEQNAAENLVKEQLKSSFVHLDNDISQTALDIVKQIGTTYSVKDVMQPPHRDILLRALTGACVNTLLLYGRNVFVANTGDCRSVLGRKEEKKWAPVPLSIDHTCNNQDEVDRITKEHPAEAETSLLFANGRLLGGLMPFRSFGDVEYKWKQEHLELINQQIRPGYYTPPYLIAEPEVSHRQLTKDDKFVVIATDGLWECLSNDKVVDMVGKKLDDQDFDDNIATVLLKHALGGDDNKVYTQLKVKPPTSRWYRDDITIVVVILK